MKPLKIEFSAFGSYPGTHTVDFTTLAPRGLFVVTGDTGTGKTTIFDAMSFALFGEMPSKDGSDIRSHHADADAKPFARFTFEIDGTVIVAERTPEHERPKLRGEGMMKESGSVLLQRIEADGTTTSLATKSREMDARIDELIGLSAEQFRRVMLLPQGEVAKFLLDNSKDREDLLSNLFGGEVYQRVANELADAAKRLAAEVSGADEQLRHHLANAVDATAGVYAALGVELPVDPDDADETAVAELLDAVEDEITELVDREDAAAAAAKRAEADHALAASTAERFDTAGKLRTVIDTDEAALPEAVAAAEAAQRSRIARPVVDAAARRDRLAANARDASDDLEHQQRKITDAADGLDGFDGGFGAGDLLRKLNELREVLADERRVHEVHQAAGRAVAEAEKKLSANAADLDAASSRRDALVTDLERLATELAELDGQPIDVASLDDAHLRLTEAQGRLADRDRLAERFARQQVDHERAGEHFETVLERYIATEAPRLADRLVDGDPCPVCGSVEHPSPARPDDGELVDMAEVDAARQRREATRLAAEKTRTELDEVRRLLGDLVEADPADLARQVAENRAERSAAMESRKQIEALAERRSATETAHADAVAKVNELTGTRGPLDEALSEAQVNAEQAANAAAGIDPSSFGPRKERIDRIDGLVQSLEGLREKVTTTATQATGAEETLRDTLASTDFVDVDGARAVLMEVHAETASITELDEVRTRLTENHAKLAALVEQGVPDERPDVDALRAAAAAARQTATAATERRQHVHGLRDAARRALADHARVGADSVDVRQREALTRRAAEVCAGSRYSKSKISLRRWVLGRELERVTAVASGHLRAMTGGRYSIRRMEAVAKGAGAKGLDLEIHDAHTGRPRRPNSLSGGEQFQASLALALGLADVVSHGGTASGRRIEALFIDEGFGSLDPRALDDAIETLHDLHASGRMVGVITHVEAMKERLHPGIVVTRLADGRGSTLRVNP
jgi:exonuclease SbcC